MSEYFDEHLFRQVRAVSEDGTIASTNFWPTPRDKELLSVDRSSLTTAKSAYDLAVGRGMETVGSYAVTSSEVTSLGIGWRGDPLDDNKAHSLIDMTQLESKSQVKKMSGKLRDFAQPRGCLHP